MNEASEPAKTPQHVDALSLTNRAANERPLGGPAHQTGRAVRRGARVNSIGGVIAIISFFLPWISACGHDFNGAQITQLYYSDWEWVSRGAFVFLFGLFMILLAPSVLVGLMLASLALSRIPSQGLVVFQFICTSLALVSADGALLIFMVLEPQSIHTIKYGFWILQVGVLIAFFGSLIVLQAVYHRVAKAAPS